MIILCKRRNFSTFCSTPQSVQYFQSFVRPLQPWEYYRILVLSQYCTRELYYSYSILHCFPLSVPEVLCTAPDVPFTSQSSAEQGDPYIAQINFHSAAVGESQTLQSNLGLRYTVILSVMEQFTLINPLLNCKKTKQKRTENDCEAPSPSVCKVDAQHAVVLSWTSIYRNTFRHEEVYFDHFPLKLQKKNLRL